MIAAVAISAMVVCFWTILRPRIDDPTGDSRQQPPLPTAGAAGTKASAAKGPSKTDAKDKVTPPEEAAAARRRAGHSALTAQMHELSRAQADAFESVNEHDREAALADFARQRRDDIDAAIAARDAFLAPLRDAAQAAAPLEEVASRNNRFASVRRALIEEGESLDEAESHDNSLSPGP